MAGLGVAPLSDRLNEDEIAEMAARLEEVGAPQLPRSTDSFRTIAEELDEDLVTEFLDQLDAYDIACEIYLPVEFDGRFEVGDLRVGSAQILIETLEEMRDEMEIEEEDDHEPGEADESYDMLDDQIRQIWRIFYTGAQASLDKRVPLHVRI